VFSNYQRGDVYSRLSSKEKEKETPVRSAWPARAAVYTLEAGRTREITILTPLNKGKTAKRTTSGITREQRAAWKKALRVCSLKIPDEHFKFLYEVAIRTK